MSVASRTANNEVRVLVAAIALAATGRYVEAETAPEPLATGDYAGYVASLLAQPDARQFSTFDGVTRIAIALDKTRSWDSAQGKQVLALAGRDALGKQRLGSVRKLLAGDVKGAVEVYANRANLPDSREGFVAIRLLREHGYPVEADAVEVLNRDLSKERIIAWVRLPADKRGPIDECMLQRYLPSNMNRRALVDIAWELYLKPPKDTGVPEQAYLDFALWFGKDTGTVDLSRATALYFGGDKKKGLAVAGWLAKSEADNATRAREAAAFVRQYGDNKVEAAALYQELLKGGEEPFIRDTRLDYLVALTANRVTPADETLEGWQEAADALRAGDACLAGGKYDEAAAKYRSVLVDASADLSRRLSAWVGLLDSDPAAALGAAEPLLDQLAAVTDRPARARLVVWLGRQLGMVAERQIPLPPGGTRYGGSSGVKPRPLGAVEQWGAKLTGIMDRLLAIDEVACLRPGADKKPSLRHAAALVYSQAGQPDKADALAKREVRYQQNPPPGGWFTFPGVPDKDWDKPREMTSPRGQEREILLAELTAQMGRFRGADPAAKITVPAPNCGVLAELAAEIARETDDGRVPDRMRRFAWQVANAFVYLDPPRNTYRGEKTPPPREVDLAQVHPVTAAVAAALENDLAARNPDVLLSDGLKKPLLAVRSPALLDALCELVEHVLDRYAEALSDPPGPALAVPADLRGAERYWLSAPISRSMRARSSG
jgi:tetratricopeptide (TPR) repeat protein